jgi:hypothetical protein
MGARTRNPSRRPADARPDGRGAAYAAARGAASKQKSARTSRWPAQRTTSGSDDFAPAETTARAGNAAVRSRRRKPTSDRPPRLSADDRLQHPIAAERLIASATEDATAGADRDERLPRRHSPDDDRPARSARRCSDRAPRRPSATGRPAKFGSTVSPICPELGNSDPSQPHVTALSGPYFRQMSWNERLIVRR